MKNSLTVLILGGGYAGILAAIRLAGRVKSNVRYVLVNADETFVERVRMHQTATGQTLRTYSIPALLRGTGVEFVQGWVNALDPITQSCEVILPDGEMLQLGYDYLILALGSATDLTKVPGAAEFALSLNGRDAAQQIGAKAAELAQSGGVMTVIGGGLSGIELASELAEKYPGVQMRLVTQGTFGAFASEAGKAYLHQTFDRLGIERVEGVMVNAVTADGITLSDGTPLASDAVVWTGGFRAAPLIQQAGLPVNERGQALVTPHLQSTAFSNIYAVGDNAALTTNGITIRMGCVTAQPMAAYAADHLVGVLTGKATAPFRFGYMFQCISLGRRDGLIQFVNPDDSPRDRILTGQAAVWFKEMIVRGTVMVLGLERRVPGAYWWPRGSKREGNAAEKAPQAGLS